MKLKKILLLSLISTVNLCFAATPVKENPSHCVSWPSYDFQPIANAKTKQIAPDYGIYWFKMQGDHEVVAKAFTPPSGPGKNG